MKIHTLQPLLLNGLGRVINMRYRSYSYKDYLRAMKMIKKLGVAETSRRLKISGRTLYHWKNGEHKPPGAKWHPEPSIELTYVIGVLFGDGYLYIDKVKRGNSYRIGVGVEDYEFAETFSKNMARLLNKKVVKPYWNKSNNAWEVTYYSKAFHVWYKEQNLDTLKPYIEYSRETVANFLRGLYDSDGNHYIYKERYNQIHLYNNNLKLLKYVRHLLEKYFNIHTTGPYLHIEAGAESKMGNGQTAKTNHNNYQISIYRKQHVQRFLNMIGFSIGEKQLGLPRRK